MLRSFMSIFSAKIGTLFLTVIITPLLVRVLGSAKYGDYAFLMSILTLIMIIVDFGTFDSTRKYIAEERSESYWKVSVLRFYIQISLISSFLISTIIVILSVSGLIETFIDSYLVIYFYFLAIIVITRQLFSVFRSGLMGLGLEHRSEPLRIIKKFLFAIIGLSLAYLGFGISGVLIGHIVAATIAWIVAVVFISYEIDVKGLFNLNSKLTPKKELLSFNILNIILIFASASLHHIDILLLQPFAGSEQTGYYRAALFVGEFIWFIPMAAQITLMHTTSKLWSEEKYYKISEIASRTVRYTILITSLLVIGIAALAEPFLELYFGYEFTAAVVPLLLLLPGVTGFAIARPIIAIGQGKGELRILIFATGSATVLNLVLNLLLIPNYGMIGAAIATSISYGSMVIFHNLAAIRIGFNPLNDHRLIRILFTISISAPAIFALSFLITSKILSLIIVPPAGFIIYLISSLKTKSIKVSEIEFLLEYIPRNYDDYAKKFLKYIS